MALLNLRQYAERWISTYVAGGFVTPVVPVWRCPLCRRGPHDHVKNCGWPEA